MPISAPRVPPDSVDQGDGPLDHALIETAVDVARAGEPDEIRRALSRCIALLREADPSRRYALCEVSVWPDGRPVMVWRVGDGDFDIVDGEAFTAWFSRARRSSGEFESVVGKRAAGIVVAIEETSDWEGFSCLIVSDGADIEPIQGRLKTIARLAAAALQRLHRRQIESFLQRRQQEAHDDAQAWLEMGIDIVWEANTDGVLHCRRVLNRRDDLARSIEGVNLAGMTIGDGGANMLDLLRTEERVRHRRVTHHNLDAHKGQTFYVSGLYMDELAGVGRPVLVGTLTATYGTGFGSLGAEASSVLAQVSTARRREEELRVEAEAMLEGLRLLLASSTSRDKLLHLTNLLSRGLGASAGFVVEAGFDGRPRLLSPEARVLDGGHIIQTLAHGLAERSLKVYAAGDMSADGLRQAFDLDGAHVAALALPLKAHMTYFLCGTRATEGFSSASLAFADRFGLLLRQALLLREEQAQLTQTAKMAALGQMSASIAHELKQPLNTISLAAQNLEAIIASPKFEASAAEAKITRMLAQVDRASNVIDRMRRFGRKSIGDNERVDLMELVEGVVSMMRPMLDQAGADVEIEVSEGLAALVDGLQVEQVLANLLQNAADAIAGVGTSAAGRRDGRIRIIGFYAPDATRQAVLRVEDNGPGFPDGVLERALEPFFTTKPAEHGTGLGLAICDAILRESGGFIELGNHTGGGFVTLHMPSVTKIT